MATPAEETRVVDSEAVGEGVAILDLDATQSEGDGIFTDAMTPEMEISCKENEPTEDITSEDATAEATMVEAEVSMTIIKDASVLESTPEEATTRGPEASTGEDQSLDVTVPEDTLTPVESGNDKERIKDSCAPIMIAAHATTSEPEESNMEVKVDEPATPPCSSASASSAQAPTPIPPLNRDDLSTAKAHLPPDPHFHMPRGPFWTPRLDALLHARTPQLTFPHLLRYTPHISFTFRRLLHIPPLNPRLSIYRQALRHTPARRRVLLIKVMQGTGQELTAALNRASEELFYLARRRQMTRSAFDAALPQLVAEGDRAVEVAAELRDWFLDEVELWGVPIDERGDVGVQGGVVLTGWDRISVCVIWRTVEVAMANYQRDVGRAMGRRWGAAAAGGRVGWRWEWDAAVVAACVGVGVGWGLWRVLQVGDRALEEYGRDGNIL